MKISFRYLCILTLFASITACKKDNYTAPDSTLSGHIVYQGEAIGVERNQVPFQMYQYGFGKVGPISITDPNSHIPSFQSFEQDGSYSAVLADGDYKIIVPNGQGPFLWKQTAAGNPDTVNVTLKGDQTLDLEVTPFYMIRNPQFAASGGNVTATFKAEQIITGPDAKNIEKVGLYIGKTQFVTDGIVDQDRQFVELDAGAIVDPNDISLSVALPSKMTAQNFIFARVGIKIAGVEDMIYSPLQQISF
jgi:hypothetical protein